MVLILSLVCQKSYLQFLQNIIIFLLKEQLDKDLSLSNVSLELLASSLRCVKNSHTYNKSDAIYWSPVLFNFDLYGDWMTNTRLEHLYTKLQHPP